MLYMLIFFFQRDILGGKGGNYMNFPFEQIRLLALVLTIGILLSTCKE